MATSEKSPIGPVTVYIDGASRGNPGPSSIGVVIQRSGKTIKEISERIGVTTNNVAEYTALIRALETLRSLHILEAHIHSDSELLVRQISGRYRVKMPHLIPLYQKVQKLWGDFSEISLVHVPREKNKKADALANQALDVA